jgi:hypothetical protein
MHISDSAMLQSEIWLVKPLMARFLGPGQLDGPSSCREPRLTLLM